ncbi:MULTISPECIES: nitrite reductase (NAD(P)H) small subunit [Enterococcus]|uniref:Nitrite reductase (NAD(P)H) small subunit n=1 Tax=Enterococcus alishanensis TaxID=1303817 RepID=A0ABS6TAW6_9ENTE|nr:nitrite reductase (NAD(P)H) small subunit [Enterococcus alishanensis]MBV7390042.1 nitrite reductase (NAD(P)H) small subunit [Enterococcus alishanensis]
MRVLATKKSNLIPRVGRSVEINNQKIAVFETTAGNIYALADFCPLTEGPILEGMVSGEYVYEPMRDFKISLIDGKIQEPDEGQVKTYPVEILADDIYIEV